MNSLSSEPRSGKIRCGFIAITGACNAGKSTLLNRFLGQKVSITSKKGQTTRNRILGILNRPGSQFVFIDTPGVREGNCGSNTRIVDIALSTVGSADAILFVVDAVSPDRPSEQMLIDRFRMHNKPVLLAINKIDRLNKPTLLKVIDNWAGMYPFDAVVPVSAKRGLQLDVLLSEIETRLPVGDPMFPEDVLTDMSERFIAAEMIREKVIRFTGQEIPYSTVVTVDLFKEEPLRNLVLIDASIHVERESQKGIVIGKQGAKLKKIGEEARKEMERMLGTRVFLKLFVRVQKNWTRDSKALKKLGYG